MTVESAKPRKLIGLQILRAISALLVVYYHLIARVVKRGFIGASDLWFKADVGHLGVCLFFAISGYVIVHTTRKSFGAEDRVRQVSIFIRRRLARICPLYYTMTFMFIIFAAVTKDKFFSISEVVRSILFIPYLNDYGIYQPVFGLGWSLNYEIIFYGIMALAMLFSRKSSVILICAVVSLLVIVGGLYGDNPKHYAGSDSFYFYTRPVMIFFVAGVVACSLPVGAIERRVAAWPLAPAAVTFVSGYLAYHLSANDWACAACVFVLIRTVSDHMTFESLWAPARRFLTFLGDASYSLYLSHSFILGGVTIVAARLVHDPHLGVAVSLAIGLGAAIVTASIVHLFVEKPLVRWAERLMRVDRGSIAPTAVDRASEAAQSRSPI